MSRLSRLFLLSAACLLPFALPGQYPFKGVNRNDPALVERFRDRGLGLFVHWSVDAPLGGVISHSLVGASPDYVERFFSVLPGQFNPDRFQPAKWAALAKLAGFEYVVLTTKHHAGFCLWDTRTTPFNVMKTPYGRDLTRELTDAFRQAGLGVGYYFSPDDFWWLHQHGIPINRHVPEVEPRNAQGLLEHDQQQVRELLTKYGPIEYLFYDGPAEGLIDFAWDIDPRVLVTRGVMETPEQYTPGVPLEGAWEGNLTMGTEWPWKPTNETYKLGRELILTMIETRAKGGNLLLNVGPKPDGELPIEQESRLREIALWMFVNGESIKGVRPWVITNEGDVWFTRRQDEATVYAFVPQTDGKGIFQQWRLGQWRDIALRSVRATERTQVTVLGQNDQVVEYMPDVNPKTTWRQDGDTLRIRANRAQRLYTNRLWPNPVVLKITNVEAALEPPSVETVSAVYDASANAATLTGRLAGLGKSPRVEVGFQWREKKGGTDLSERTEPWTDLPLTARTAIGEFTAPLRGLTRGRPYEVRAVVKHPLLTLYSREREFRAR